MASCTCEKQNFLTAYNDETAQIKTTNPSWTDHEVRLQTAYVLRPKFAKDIQAARVETSGAAEYLVDDEFTLTSDGRARWIGYGRYMGELDERTERLTPGQYTASDAVTTSSIEMALRHGARTIVTSYARRGGDNRDLIVITYDPLTNRGRMTIINTAINGERRDFQNITKVAADTFSNLQLHRPTDTTFLLTDVRIPDDRPRAFSMKTSPVGAVYKSDNIAQIHPPVSLREDLRATGRKNTEVHPGASHEQLHNRNGDQIFAFPATGNRRHIFERDKAIGQKSVVWTERLMQEAMLERSSHAGTIIEKRYAEYRQGKKKLAFIAKTGIAVHAAPAIFARLAEKPPRLITAMEKSVRRHKRKELRIKKYELNRETKRQVKTEWKKRRKERIDKNTAAAEKLSTSVSRKLEKTKTKQRRVRRVARMAELASKGTSFRGGEKERVPEERMAARAVAGVRFAWARIQQRESSWILLSIIWYLAALRESALPISNSKYQILNRKIKKTKTNHHPFPHPLAQRGVIFAFQSW